MSGRRSRSPRSGARSDRARRRPRVEALEGRQLLATFTVTTTQDALSTSPLSLRSAILAANNAGGPDIIAFNIAGSGTQTIRVNAQLPAITDVLRVDGTTQPGYQGIPLIELDGTTAGAGTNGLRLSTGRIEVDALAINRFSGSGLFVEGSGATITRNALGTNPAGNVSLPNGNAGIFVSGASNTRIGGFDTKFGSLANVIGGNSGGGINLFGSGASSNVIVGNFIGTNTSGTLPLGNSGHGIVINGGAFNRIGGDGPGEANVISGNTGNGILVLGASATNTNILGNFIGTDGSATTGVDGLPTGGNVAIPNGGAGVSIDGAPRTVIGGTSPGLRNVISGNQLDGVSIVGGVDTTIQGNIIGADSTGVRDLGNSGPGVGINGGDGTIVGGTLEGAGNVIAWNGRTFQEGGVNVFGSTRRVPILSNSFFNNFGRGIILFTVGGDAPVNDPGDPDTGANDLQNFPVLTQAATAAGRTLIQGSLNSTPNSTFTVQFFSSPTRDPSGFGEGQTLLGSTLVTTDGSGLAVINVTLGTPSVIDAFVAATATDNLGNTSEFSPTSQVDQAKQAALAISIEDSPDPATLGADLTYTITVSNAGPDPATNVRVIQTVAASVGSLRSPDIPVIVAGNLVLADLGTIAPGQQVVYTVIGTPTVKETVASTVTVTSGEIDPDVSDNSDAESTEVNIPADLGVVLLTSDPVSVTVGQNVAITAVVKNFGPGATTGTTLTVPIPEGASFVSAAAGQGTAVFSNGVVTARLGSLASGASVAVRIVVTAPIEVPGTGALRFTATAEANEIEPALPPGVPDPNPNVQSLDVIVDASSDLVLTLVAAPEPVLAGERLTYTYMVVNNGPSPATDVTVTSPLPAGVSFDSVDLPSQGTASLVDGTITALLGDLAPGGSAVGTFVVRPQAPGLITSTAKVELEQPDPDLSNNAAIAVATVSPADLEVLASVAPDPAEVGQPLTYTLFVTNRGPAEATNVTVSDFLPPGVTFVSAVATQGLPAVQQDGVVTVNLGTLAPGARVPVTIVVIPPVSTTLVNRVVASSDQIDINGGDNSVSTATNVSPADLGVTLAASPGAALAGDSITFTAIVTNSGPTTATGVTLTNVLPAGLHFVSATTSQGEATDSGGTVTARIGSLAAGGTATVTIVGIPLIQGSYLNTVTVAGDQVDPVPGNNQADVSASVTNGPGVLQFAATSFAADENAGVAIITVSRVSGNLGQATVQFATADGTAIGGTNFRPTSGTLTFEDGEISKSFSVPLLADGVVRGDTTILLSLTNPTGGASLGPNAVATLIVRESDFDVTGPTVTNLQSVGTGRTLRGVRLAFDEALDPARASSAANYSIFVRGGRRVAFTPKYDAATRTVTLTTARPLPLNAFHRVIVSPSVTDVFNNPLRGVTGGGNGQSFSATFARGSSLRFVDHDGDLVSLNLTNGGLLDISRDASGDGQVMRVLGAGPRRSVLSGNVRRGSVGSDGAATFRSILGAEFGRVNSRLTTPNFFVDDVTAFIRGGPAPARGVAVSSARPFAARNLGRAFRRGS